MAIMLGLTIFLDISPFGAIPIGSVSATIVQIPTIVTAIVLGPIYGMIMGGIFGIVSLIHALTRPVTPLDPLFINPLISVLPRILIGLFSGWTFVLITKITNNKRRSIGAVAAGAVGAITNTVFVLGALYFMYAEQIIEKLGLGTNQAFIALIWTIVSSNGVIEAIVCAILAGGITIAYDTVKARTT